MSLPLFCRRFSEYCSNHWSKIIPNINNDITFSTVKFIMCRYNHQIMKKKRSYLKVDSKHLYSWGSDNHHTGNGYGKERKKENVEGTKGVVRGNEWNCRRKSIQMNIEKSWCKSKIYWVGWPESAVKLRAIWYRKSFCWCLHFDINSLLFNNALPPKKNLTFFTFIWLWSHIKLELHL